MPDTEDVPEATLQHGDTADTLPARGGGLVDPGWLFLIAGLAIVAATLLIPAAEDLKEAQYLRDSAQKIAAHREQRIKAYDEYYEALTTREKSLVMSLAASQLNQIPADRSPIPGVSDGTPRALTNASVFPALEPPALEIPKRVEVQSTLKRLATGESTRLWLIAAGAACVLVGVLPKAKTR